MAVRFPLKAKERAIPDGTTLPQNLTYRPGHSPTLPHPIYEQKRIHDTTVVSHGQPPASASGIPISGGLYSRLRRHNSPMRGGLRSFLERHIQKVQKTDYPPQNLALTIKRLSRKQKESLIKSEQNLCLNFYPIFYVVILGPQ